MNIVLDNASEANIKLKTRKNLGISYLMITISRKDSIEGR